MVSQHVSCSGIAPRIGPLLFGIRQLGCADSVRDGASHTSNPATASTSINTGGMTGALVAGRSSLMRAMGHWLAVADLQGKDSQKNNVRCAKEQEIPEIQTQSIHLYLWCVRSRAGPQAVIMAPLPHLWLAIHQSLRLAVSTCITDVQTAQ